MDSEVIPVHFVAGAYFDLLQTRRIQERLHAELVISCENTGL